MEREFARTLQDIDEESRGKLQLVEREAEDKRRRDLQTMESARKEHDLKMLERMTEARARITDNAHHLESAYSMAKSALTGAVIVAGVGCFVAGGVVLLGPQTVAIVGAWIAIQFERIATWWNR
ncbi:hypothetical protein PoB_000215600 [Plakobranchus ocellatus]|uniref:Uncharacterized protein n=1 Tax=Plakobranchus ocellatus TaxID=259542 RepID=A0AAV3X856_9GAST|nr:hypothetical protein PoB_000215600 [Plakobranchus ocellatus]